MKRVVLVSVSILICGMAFFFVSSCNKEDNMSSALNIKAVVVAQSVRSAPSEDDERVSTRLWCQGKDIEWYNETTGELKLKNNSDMNCVAGLVVYLDDKKLFTLEVVNGASSIATDFPCINWEPVEGYGRCLTHLEDHTPLPSCEYMEYIVTEAQYYISKGYPRWADVINEEREKNWKAIENEWNIFIKQLKKEGKYRK